ncbi:MAG: alanine racemase [Puniceicoccales bacterium]|jgi:alanine racemase|nr:alanine racemase [Puniceicoccales bacterium]
MMRGVLEINLNLLAANIAKIKKAMPAGLYHLAAIKTNAYGLGLEKIASFLGKRQPSLVDGFAVLGAQEALEIRFLGIDLPICILSPVLKGELEDLYQAKATPLISSVEEVDMLQNFAQEKQYVQPIHIKIDTGMGRLGVWFEKIDEFFAHIRSCDHLKVCGLATHFSSVASDATFTQLQLERFQKIVQRYGEADWMNHAASSFAIDRFIEGTNTVRIGALYYGIPEDNPIVKRLGLESVVRLSGPVTLVKRIPAGTKIGYEQTYYLPKDTKIAIVSLGYADGIPITLSNCGEVLIHGKRCKIIGRVSMDQVTIDVSDLEEVAVSDEAVFFGKQGAEEIPFCEFAQRAQLLMRAAYLASLSERRVVRKYIPEIFSMDYSSETKNYQSFFSPF